MLSHGTFWPMPWLWMWVFPLIGLVIMIVMVTLVLRRGCWRFRCMGREDQEISSRDATAMETLKRRYASGEISREEFERIKQDIE